MGPTATRSFSLGAQHNMGQNATSFAVVRESDSKVVTFVRLDLPSGYVPPQGCVLVPDDELPEGWERYEEPQPVPKQLYPRQLRIWLIRNGVSLATIDAIIDAIPNAQQREEVRTSWEYGLYYVRTDPTIEAIGFALGMSSAAIDQAFREAVSI